MLVFSVPSLFGYAYLYLILVYQVVTKLLDCLLPCLLIPSSSLFTAYVLLRFRCNLPTQRKLLCVVSVSSLIVIVLIKQKILALSQFFISFDSGGFYCCAQWTCC